MKDKKGTETATNGYQPQKDTDRSDGRRVTGGYTPTIKNEDSQGKPPKKP